MSVKRLARLKIVSTLCYGQQMLKTKSTDNVSLPYPNSAFSLCYLAEGAGFEPASPEGLPVFKTGGFNRSPTPPGHGFGRATECLNVSFLE